MTQPIQEPWSGRRISQLQWGENQLFRRPGQNRCAFYEIKVFGDTNVVATGDGKFIWGIPEDLDGWEIFHVFSFVSTVSSSGLVTVQIRNITAGVDTLSTPVTIDAGDFTSYGAATEAVIDTANAGVSVADLMSIDVDAAGTGAKGLGVGLRLCPSVNPTPLSGQNLQARVLTTTEVAVTTSRRRRVRARSFRTRP